jgi:hypothetical protein
MTDLRKLLLNPLCTSKCSQIWFWRIKRTGSFRSTEEGKLPAGQGKPPCSSVGVMTVARLLPLRFAASFTQRERRLHFRLRPT